jgi:hypothetical protein
VRRLLCIEAKDTDRVSHLVTVNIFGGGAKDPEATLPAVSWTSISYSYSVKILSRISRNPINIKPLSSLTAWGVAGR